MTTDERKNKKRRKRKGKEKRRGGEEEMREEGDEGSRKRLHYFLGYKEGLVSNLAVKFIIPNEKCKERELRDGLLTIKEVKLSKYLLCRH